MGFGVSIRSVKSSIGAFYAIQWLTLFSMYFFSLFFSLFPFLIFPRDFLAVLISFLSLSLSLILSLALAVTADTFYSFTGGNDFPSIPHREPRARRGKETLSRFHYPLMYVCFKDHVFRQNRTKWH